MHPITLEATAKLRPRDALAYMVLDDGASEVAACLEFYRELLAKRFVHRVCAEKGMEIEDLASKLSSPMIVGVINKMPVAVAALPTDLDAFCAKTESYLPMMLPEFKRPQ